MSTQLSRLANGLRVVSHHMPHLETVSLGVWVAAGARHEQEDEHGISHLLEHMAFKGTERRSATDIAEEIEAVGGELNAATSLETTAYFARILKSDIGIALDILADILQIPRYAQDELEREREVILQEIAATRDSPDEIAYELLQDASFPNQAIGRPILGTTQSVTSFGADDLRTFLKAQYGAGRMVVSAAGSVDHGELLRHAEAQFAGLNGGVGGRFEPARYVGGTRTSAKPFEQSHLVMAFAGPSYRSPEFYTAQVFSGLFGGGMSSRLFQEVREQRGLCYSIYTFHSPYTDSGVFGLYAGTDAADVGELMRVVVDEINAAAETVNEDEIGRAKAQMKAGLLMALESSSARAEQLARQIINWGRPIPLDEIVAKIEAVSVESTRAAGRALIARGRPAIAALGPGSGLECAATIADSLARQTA